MKIVFAALFALGIAVTAVGVARAQTVSPSPSASPTTSPTVAPTTSPTVPAGAPSTGRG